MGSVNGVFIIESLDIADEKEELFEGEILKRMLKMLDVEVKYVYIRTRNELKYFIDEFEKSDYKYLHISCHGNDEGIGMTLNDETISFSQLDDMFSDYGRNKRVFFSSCSVMSSDNIINEMSETQFLSITGPLTDISFQEGAIFWASFYHLMFTADETGMNNEHLKDTLQKLSTTFDVKVSTIIRKKKSRFYNRYCYPVQLEETKMGKPIPVSLV